MLNRWIRQQKWWHFLPAAIALGLFLMPFFWFRPGEGDFGGDSSRLYFYDPLNFLLHSMDRTIATLNIPAISWIPLTAVLAVLQRIVGQHSSFILPLFDGVLFAVAFIAVYALVRELVSEDSWQGYCASVLGGLCYVTSGLVTYNAYRFPSAYHSIAVYPFILLLLVRYIRTAKIRYLFFGALVSLVFSTNFAFDAAPVGAAFVLFGGLFIILYGLSTRRLKVAIKGSALLGVLILGVQAYHLVPQFIVLLNTESATNALVFSDSGAIDRGLRYFQGNRSWVRLVYNMIAFPQYFLYTNVGAPPAIVAAIYTFGVKYIAYFFALPVTIALGVFFHVTDTQKKRRYTFLSLFVVFAAILYFMTANVFGYWGPRLYEMMFSIPGFSMFRSFYGVFALVLSFFFALIFGFSAFYLLTRLRYRSVGVVVVAGFAALMVYGAIPLIRGDIANLLQDQTKGVRVSHKIPAAYDAMVKSVRDNPFDAAIVTLPLTGTDHQIIAGEHGGAYIGASPFVSLAGRSTYAGLMNLDYAGASPFKHEFFLERIGAGDYRTIQRWFSLMNVGFIFNDSNPATYRDQFIGWPFSKELFTLFPSIGDFETLVTKLGYNAILKAGSYTLNTSAENFLPRLYVPRAVFSVRDQEEMQKILIEKNDYDIRSVFLVGSDIMADIPAYTLDAPDIEFSRTNSNRYRIRAHNVRSSFPLVLSVPYQRGWHLYPVQPSPIPMGSTQFISPSYQDVVQNQNLPKIKLRDGFGKKPIGDDLHLVANNFSNLWWISVAELERTHANEIMPNNDGSYDLEFVLMYMPERHIYWGVVVSLLTVLGMGLYGGLSWWLMRKKQRKDYEVLA